MLWSLAYNQGLEDLKIQENLNKSEMEAAALKLELAKIDLDALAPTVRAMSRHGLLRSYH